MQGEKLWCRADYCNIPNEETVVLDLSPTKLLVQGQTIGSDDDGNN